MYAVNTYEQIERQERELREKHIIVLLFVRPNLAGAADVIGEFDHIEYTSKRFCSIYAVGYTRDAAMEGKDGFRKVPASLEEDWYFSEKAFVEFKENLERRLSWRYSGEIELIVLQSNPEGRQILNFQNYVAIDVNYGLRNEYLDSFPRFMESLMRSARSEVDAAEAVKKTGRSRVSVKDVIASAVEECKKVPAPVRRILKDRLFYLVSSRKA